MRTICIVLLFADIARADRFARVFDYDWPGQHDAVQYELPDLDWQSPPVGNGFFGTYYAGLANQFAISGIDPISFDAPIREFTVRNLYITHTDDVTHVTSNVLFHSVAEPTGFQYCLALVVALTVYYVLGFGGKKK